MYFDGAHRESARQRHRRRGFGPFAILGGALVAWLMMACVDITPTPQIDASADDGDQGDDGTSEAGDDGSSTDAGAPVQDEAEAAAYDE